MKSINIAELKSHLSRYLRAVRRGERIVVLDRREPVAEIGPPRTASSPWERMELEGRITLGKQDWGSLRVVPLKKPVPIQKLLRQVREDIV
jgi:antitoxin (DNA-binding transcriptional repressor) of toxin-antitoxin stability system